LLGHFKTDMLGTWLTAADLGPVARPVEESCTARYLRAVPELRRLCADHAAAVLAFEEENRAYFAAAVSDRGDAFYRRFTEGFDALLAEQKTGACVFHVLLAADGSVLGRFNLYDLEDGAADLGYRVAQHASGRGLATAGVGQLCRLAWTRYGLRTLRAAVASTNPASRRVLEKTGFVAVGPADPSHLGGKQGTSYECDLRLITRL
jgi:RimJ/RimL family protein N-acetyltransferase